jgi:hypothetical protein
MRLGWDQKRLAKWPETYAPKLGQMCKDVIWLPTRDDLVTQMRTVAQVSPEDEVDALCAGDPRPAGFRAEAPMARTA